MNSIQAMNRSRQQADTYAHTNNTSTTNDSAKTELKRQQSKAVHTQMVKDDEEKSKKEAAKKLTEEAVVKAKWEECKPTQSDTPFQESIKPYIKFMHDLTTIVKNRANLIENVQNTVNEIYEHMRKEENKKFDTIIKINYAISMYHTYITETSPKLIEINKKEGNIRDVNLRNNGLLKEIVQYIKQLIILDDAMLNIAQQVRLNTRLNNCINWGLKEYILERLRNTGNTGYDGLQTFVHDINPYLYISTHYKGEEHGKPLDDKEVTAMVQPILTEYSSKANKYMKYKTKYLTLKNKMLDIV